MGRQSRSTSCKQIVRFGSGWTRPQTCVFTPLKERPIDRFFRDRSALRALPLPFGGRRTDVRMEHGLIVPTPIESLQHPLATYDALAEVAHA